MSITRRIGDGAIHADRGVSMHGAVWVDGSSPVRVVADLNAAEVVIGEERVRNAR